MKKLFLILVLVSMLNFASAIPFDTGATGGTVNMPGDYASLKAAADAFNALSGGIQANWTLSITASTTETENVAFGNLTNGKTLTIKPAATKSPTILFSATTAFGIYAHLVFGVKQVTGDPVEADYFETTNGYVIDGNNGGTPGERNLTLTNGTVSATGRIITIFGKTNGMIIKNTKIIQHDTAGTVWCIRWAGGSLGTKTNIAADGGTVENCLLSAASNPASGAGVSFSPVANAPELAAGYCFNNIQILNNDVISAQRGLMFDSVGNVTIRGNKITISGTANGLTATGIYHWDANDYTGYTINIEDNIIDISTANITAAYGIYGILIDSITDATSVGTVNIRNNILKNFGFTGATPADFIYRPISLGRRGVTYNVEHNSINMPFSDKVLGTTAGYPSAVNITSGVDAGAANLKNNLIRMAQTGTGAYVINAATGTLTSAGNNLVSAGGAAMGRIGTTPYADFAAWQAAGYDTTATGGQSVDPAYTSPPWDSGLKFAVTGLPDPMHGVASSSVLTDIDGEVRPATGATPGADQPHVYVEPPLAVNSTWGLYE